LYDFLDIYAVKQEQQQRSCPQRSPRPAGACRKRRCTWGKSRLCRAELAELRAAGASFGSFLVAQGKASK
jgi:hypothetical protein